MPEAAKDIERKSSAKHNWKFINQNSAAIRLLDRDNGYLREAVFGSGVEKDTARPRFPFRIYYTPNSRRVTPDPDAWRKFRVQSGYCNNVKTAGCDDTDGEGTVAEDITVPIDEEANTILARYYVWVEIEFSAGTNVDTAQIKHGDTPADNGWTSYPDPSGSDGKLFVMLGWIDDDGTRKAKVRQFQFQDILVTSAGAGDARWA